MHDLLPPFVGMTGKRQRKGKEIASTSRTIPEPTVPTLGIQFTKEQHLVNYTKLSARKIRPTLFNDWVAVDLLGIREEVQFIGCRLGPIPSYRGQHL